jgi:GT2 family glycosyltransferase
MAKDLDIIIVSHNVKSLLAACLDSVFRPDVGSSGWNVIVVDSGSNDGTPDFLRKKYGNVTLLASKQNLGFSGGNNYARKNSNAEFILFLNPDTKIIGNAINNTLKIIKSDSKIGAITCKVMLPNGKLDYSCHRGLPTILNTFNYWSGLSALFPTSKFFSGYTASYLDINKSSEIDCVSGTYLLIRRSILDKIGWWDTDYFWNGEDIEMCYQIKKQGAKIWYAASEKIIHYKGSSSGLWQTAGKSVPTETKLKTARHAAAAMRIFMNKHKKELGPVWLTSLALLGILLLEKYRLFKLKIGLKYA